MAASNKLRLGISVALYVASFVGIAIFAQRDSVPGVIASLALLIVASIVFNTALLRHREAHGEQWQKRVALPVGMLIAGVVSLIVWFTGAADGFGFGGACLILLGIGHLIAELRWSPRWRRILGPTLVALSLVLLVGGVLVASFTSGLWPILVAGTGILIAPAGLSILSGMVLNKYPRSSRTTRIWGLVGGAALAAVGVWMLVILGGIEFRFAAIIGVVLFLLVGAITSNTPAEALVGMAVIALAWAITPSGVPTTDSVRADDRERVMVAMGDSFMSGEGAEEFYDGTNHEKENECRRSPTAYAAVVVDRDSRRVPDDVAFVACSGAKAVHIFKDAQFPGEPIGGPTTTTVDGTVHRGLNQLAHLQWLRTDKKVDVAFVIVSIGGNDALFGEIGRTCVGPGDCTEIGARWLANLQNVKTTIDQAYQEIRYALGDRIPVVVVPYPVPISPFACPDSLLTANEHRFLNGFTRELNRVLARAASDAGLLYVEEMATVLEQNGLRICDGSAGEVGVNFFGFNAVDGLIEQRVNPLNWTHNSLHPNQRGHRVMADALQAWLEARPIVAARPDPAQELGPPQTPTIEQIMGDANFRHCGNPSAGLTHCDGSATDWLINQIVQVVKRNIFPSLVLVGGAWVFWLFVTWSWRSRRTTRPALAAPDPDGTDPAERAKIQTPL